MTEAQKEDVVNTPPVSEDVIDNVEELAEDVEVEEEINPLEAALAEVQEWKDRHLRLQAEWDTYRRRMNEQRNEEKLRATEKLVEHLIPVMDDFERSIDYANQHGETGLLSGVEAVYAKLVGVLSSDGVEILNPQDEEFNALEAQAIGTVEDSTVPEDTVVEVFQKGYKMGIKVLRPAMVRVSQGGPLREKQEEE